jgi:hypothetical protein
VLSCGVIGFALGGLLHSGPWLAHHDDVSVVRASLVVQATGLAVVAAGLHGVLPVAAVYLGWAFTGLGAGLAITALNVVVLGLSTPTSSGTAASAMVLAESVAAAAVTAVAGLATAGAAGPQAAASAAGLIVAGCVVVVLAVCAALTRLRPASL